MSANLIDPYPHGAIFTSFGSPVSLSPPARELILSNFAAGACSITVITVNGETLVIALGTLTVATPPISLPIQCSQIVTATGIGTAMALWH